MTKIDLLVPVPPDVPAAEMRLAQRQPLSDKSCLTLIENGKPKARMLLGLLGERLEARLGIGHVSVFSKGAASRVINDEEVATLVDYSDVVISGLGDCGACSACCLGDALRMEAAGVPSTVLISDVFGSHVASFAARMGLPGYHAAVVPHPVASKQPEELAHYADGIVDAIVGQLVGTVALQGR